MYGEGLLCGYGRIGGHLVAVVANNGILDSHAARKGAHFVHLATERRIPLIFLQNSVFHEDFDETEGDKAVSESADTTRARAGLIAAVSVSKVSIISD